MSHPFEASLMPGICVRCERPHPAEVPPDHGQARHTDPETSKEAARLVKPGSARYRLLEAHAQSPSGLTDEEAALDAGLSLASEYATRCSELRRAGFLKDSGFVRTGSSGMARMVRQITPEGREALD